MKSHFVGTSWKAEADNLWEDDICNKYNDSNLTILNLCIIAWTTLVVPLVAVMSLHSLHITYYTRWRQCQWKIPKSLNIKCCVLRRKVYCWVVGCVMTWIGTTKGCLDKRREGAVLGQDLTNIGWGTFLLDLKLLSFLWGLIKCQVFLLGDLWRDLH